MTEAASNDTEGAEEASPAPAVEAAPAAAPAADPAAAPAAAGTTAEGTPAPEEIHEHQAVAAALKVLTPYNADFGTSHIAVDDFILNSMLMLQCMQHLHICQQKLLAAQSDAA